MLDGLSYKECLLLNDICRLSIDICKVYDGLYQLEISGLRESVQFNTKLDYLKKLVSEENDLYNMIVDVKDIEKIFGFVVVSYFKDIKLDVNAMLMQYQNKDYDEMARIRIIKKLEFRLNILSMDSKDYRNIEKSLMFNDVKQKKFYSILESCIIDNSDINKNILIYEKYFNALFLDNDERILLNNSFYVQDYENIEINLEEQFGDELRNSIIEFLKNEIKKLLCLTDEDYESPDTKIVLFIGIVYFRSYFMMMNEDDISVLNIWFNEYILSNEYLASHKFDKKYKKTEEYIIDAFKKYNDDRGKYLIKKKTDNKKNDE